MLYNMDTDLGGWEKGGGGSKECCCYTMFTSHKTNYLRQLWFDDADIVITSQSQNNQEQELKTVCQIVILSIDKAEM